MKFLPIILLPIAAMAQEPICSETHEVIMDMLTDIYGEENCVKSGPGDLHPWGFTLVDPLFNCEVSFPGYTTYSHYTFKDGNEKQPLDLKLVSTNLDGDGNTITSLLTNVDFEFDCIDDEIQNHLSSIENKLVGKPFCYNVVVPFVYKKKKEITCNKLAGLEMGKQRKLCTKHEVLSDNCPGICRSTEVCRCANNPVPFLLGGGETSTCDELAALPDKEKQKKCKGKKYGHFCPDICNSSCQVGN